MKTIRINVLTPLADGSISYKKDQYLTIKDGQIRDVLSQPPVSGEYKDYSHLLCLPGFIDLHVHLSQLNVRGKHAKDLLDWLENYIFAEEKKASDHKYAGYLAEKFFSALSACGTTTAVVYVAPDPEACNIAFEKARDSGLRIIMGQTLMDRNCPDYLCRGTQKSLEEAISLYNQWNGANDLLEYIFTPRFAPVCSPELMRGIGKFASENNAFIQTHLSENRHEIQWVKELFPDYNSYTEVYEKHGLLGAKTLLGHAIHLSDEELKILARTHSKITHCPDSNFFLNSGVFPLKKILQHKIDFGLGSDVGAGTTLYMPQIMKMFIYRQDEYPVTPADALYYSTLGAAVVLGKENKIGSIEKDKDADLIMLQKPDNIGDDRDDILSYLTYLSTSRDITYTYVAGKECYGRAKK